MYHRSREQSLKKGCQNSVGRSSKNDISPAQFNLQSVQMNNVKPTSFDGQKKRLVAQPANQSRQDILSNPEIIMTQDSPDAGDNKLAMAMCENLKNIREEDQYYPIMSDSSPEPISTVYNVSNMREAAKIEAMKPEMMSFTLESAEPSYAQQQYQS